MTRRLVAACVAAGVLISASAFAHEAFDARTFTGKTGQTLSYRIHAPTNLPADARCPLVLVLHGAGQRGDDNAQHIAETYGPIELLSYSRANQLNAIIIAPQVPKGQQWVNVPWGDDRHTMPKEPSDVMRLTLALLKDVMATLPVDRTRIYVTGLSMGGFGTWDIIQREPTLFAAAMPICGGGDTGMAAQLTTLPIWAFHGARDPVVKPRRTIDMIDAVRKAGGKPKMSVFPGTRHDAWKQVYKDGRNEYLSWLFAQKQ